MHQTHEAVRRVLHLSNAFCVHCTSGFALQELIVTTGTLHAIQCNLSSDSNIMEMFKTVGDKFGHIDVLINHAAFLAAVPLRDFSTEDFTKTINASRTENKCGNAALYVLRRQIKFPDQ